MRATLVALLSDPSDVTEAGLAEARRRRAANPTMTVAEIEALGEAERLVRAFTDRGAPEGD
ncbi:hypothetical protein [Streptomyces sp. NPDC048002]|uniref:hypothetical protein n=1 Tax=Streptomyces sp. NPDC048002 TaxID=3154344 RepID=UPI0033F1ACC6